MKQILGLSVMGFLSALVVTRISMVLAHRFGAVDRPGHLKIHERSVPRLGGLGIVCGTLVGSAFATLWNLEGWIHWFAFVIGGILVALIGFLDDLRGLNPSWKLCGQLAAGLLFLIASHAGDAFVQVRASLPPTSWLQPLVVAPGLILFIALMSNAINLLDGMDAMAGGLGALMALFLALSGFLTRASGVCPTGLSLAAACLGFLVFNRPPARTFMGDSGSLYIGFVLAVLALRVTLNGKFSPNTFFGVLLILSVPLVDTGFAIIRRLLRREYVFGGDRFHLYDCLHLRLGRKIGRTLGAMYALVATGGALGAATIVFESVPILLAGAFFLVVVCLVASSIGCLGITAFPVPPRKAEEMTGR